MEYRQLGASGLYVPALSFGTATFGGNTDFFKAWGTTQADEATRLVDLCLDYGMNLFDTADIYSNGLSEEILGKAIAGKRDRLILSTKATFPFGTGPNNMGSSRYRLLRQVEDSLRRLGTDHIDIYHMHGFDGVTPVEETLRTLDDLVQSGKVRYIAASNFSGWHLMKSIAVAEKYGWNRYVGHQVYYSLANREYEWELMPLAQDQQVGAIIWSPLAGGKLGGRVRRSNPKPEGTRTAAEAKPFPRIGKSDEFLYTIIDALDEVAAETGKSVAQVALNWLLRRPTVASIIVGAKNEEQLKENLGAVGWALTAEQIQKLDTASDSPLAYPYWHQRLNPTLNPPPKFV